MKRTFDLVDALRPIATAIIGAKRPDQISATAGGKGWKLSPATFAAIDAALAARGKPITRGAV